MMIKTLSLLLIGSSLIACANVNTESETSTETTDTTATVEEVQDNGKYGAEITADNAVSPAEFLAMMEGKDSLEVKVKGNIAASCVKKGCWMDLDLENGSTMKVKFKDYGFFIPLDSKGKTTIVQGKAYLTETPVDELKHYAEDGGKSQEEIDAITEPEIAYTFIADGVIVE